MDEYKEKVVRERSEGDHESWRDNQFGFGLPYIWPCGARASVGVGCMATMYS